MYPKGIIDLEDVIFPNRYVRSLKRIASLWKVKEKKKRSQHKSKPKNKSEMTMEKSCSALFTHKIDYICKP